MVFIEFIYRICDRRSCQFLNKQVLDISSDERAADKTGIQIPHHLDRKYITKYWRCLVSDFNLPVRLQII